MIGRDRYRGDILIQGSVTKPTLDTVATQVLEVHVRACVRNVIQADGGEDAIAELMEVVRKVTP